MKQEDFNSDLFWDNRYREGGNSWLWSYWENAIYKANFINKIIKEHNIQSAVEIGCWDWANLWLYNIQRYKWYDVSQKAIDICNEMYKEDNTKEFYVNNENTDFYEAELSLWLDMIYHIFPRAKWEKMVDKIIEAWKKYVILYTTINPTKWVEWSCMNDYDILEYLDSKWIKYTIEETRPPESLAVFITITK
jgi:hypothetical protein